MHPVLETLSNLAVIPVVKLDRAADALPLMEALRDGGLPCAEITFRTDAAQEAIRLIAQADPDFLVGAGTVTNLDQLDRACEAGAKFIVSPGFDREIVAACLERGIPVTPGVSSASEVQIAMGMGLEVLKFFPAEQAGGIPMLKALAGPFAGVRFVPTGGINAGNIGEYLALKNVAACGGTWMVKADLIDGGRFDEIRDKTAQAVGAVLDFRLAHVGINTPDEGEALRGAESFLQLFGLATKVGNSSIFAGAAVELLKKPGRGASGHIAFSTPSVDRAYYLMKLRGIRFAEDSALHNADGTLKAIYFADEIAGFAIHLVRR